MPGFNGIAIKPDYQGKVRELYDLGDELLIVATDRLSAFDVVFDQLIPGKGKVLNRISNAWFQYFQKLGVANHFVSADTSTLPDRFLSYQSELQERFLVANKGERIDFEFIVRGYLMGSAWSEYSRSKSLWGVPLPDGLKKGDALPEPVLTATTKADSGHDEAVTIDQVRSKLGDSVFAKIESLAMTIFSEAAKLLRDQNVLILDTKFEFALIDKDIVLIDEVLTPDSSRFSLRDEYESAISQGLEIPTMDKQIIRDYLQTIEWDYRAPAPELPEDVIEHTIKCYEKIEEIILCSIK